MQLTLNGHITAEFKKFFIPWLLLPYYKTSSSYDISYAPNYTWLFIFFLGLNIKVFQVYMTGPLWITIYSSLEYTPFDRFMECLCYLISMKGNIMAQLWTRENVLMLLLWNDPLYY